METEFEEMIDLCEESVEALERGTGTTDDCCVKTRSLHFACKLLAGMSYGMLTPPRTRRILDIFGRAKRAASERSAQSQERAATAEEKAAARKEVADARRIAGRTDEIESVLARFAVTEDPSPVST